MKYIALFEGFLNNYKGEKFSVTYWNGKTSFFGTKGKIVFNLLFKNELALKRLLTEGSLGFGECYMDGSLDVKGNIENYLMLRHKIKHNKISKKVIFLKLFSLKNRKENRISQISQHYDLGTDFFKLILDNKTMMYSSGLYTNNKTSLESAQTTKIEFLAKWLNLPQGSEILDLGFGWGEFAMHCAVRQKWRVTGFTLSKKQLEYVKDLVKKRGLKSKISLKFLDFTNIKSKKKYDGAIILESIEHVGQKDLQQFFNSIRRNLKPGAPFIIQTTGRHKFRLVDRWTLKYVFPGGYLPTVDELFKYAGSAGFKIEQFRDDTDDYIHTLKEWIRNLEKNQIKIEKMYGKPFYRLWYLWMHGAKVNFEVKDMSLFRLKLKAKI